MSYDLKIWSTTKIEPINETKIGDCTITVDESVLVEDEDIPTYILLSRKTTRYLTEIHIQPFTQDPEIISATLKIAKKLAKSSDGSIENPQEEKGNDPISGQFKKEKESETVKISWYMIPTASLDEKYIQLVDIFEDYMPNALPRRYGDYEPPQHKYEQTGKEHFIQNLKSSKGDLVWYATNPIQYVFISDATRCKVIGRYGFRANVIQLIVLKKAYLDHSWNKALVKIFKEVSLILDPFYAEIVDSKNSNILGWWWKGLPPHGGYVTIIGKPYLDLITKVSSRGTKISENLVFLTDSKKTKFPRKYVFKVNHKKLTDLFQFMSKKLENGKYVSILVMVIDDKIYPSPIRIVTKKSLNPWGVTSSKLSSDKYRYASKFPFHKFKDGNSSSNRQSIQTKTNAKGSFFKIKLIVVLIFLFAVVSFLTGLVFALGMSFFGGFSWISVLFGPLYWLIMILVFMLLTKLKKYQYPHIGRNFFSNHRLKNKLTKTTIKNTIEESLGETFKKSNKKVTIETYELPKSPKKIDGPLIYPLDYGDPDIQVAFTNSRFTQTTISTGYRGMILVKDNHLTTGIQSFLNGEEVKYNETILTNIKFISPEKYPATFWIGRVLRVQEGNRVIGQIKVNKIYNQRLDRDLAIPCVDSKKALSNYDLLNKALRIKLSRSGSVPFDVEILRDFSELSGQEIQNLTDFIDSGFKRAYDLLVKMMDFESLEFGNDTDNTVKLEFPWMNIENIEKFKYYLVRVNM